MNVAALKDEVRASLLADSIDDIAAKWLLEAHPFLFRLLPVKSYWNWKATLGKHLAVDPKNIVVIGSAAVGVSLSPFKNLRDFSPRSDVDVAVVDAYHFDTAWNTLRHLGAHRYSLSGRLQSSIDDHRTKYIYWGTVVLDALLPIMPFAISWQAAAETMRRMDPTQGREINFRLYRDFAALSAYLRQSLEDLRSKVLATPTSQGV